MATSTVAGTVSALRLAFEVSFTYLTQFYNEQRISLYTHLTYWLL
jgi:hypothetical protein